jgi:hypothetical protein
VSKIHPTAEALVRSTDGIPETTSIYSQRLKHEKPVKISIAVFSPQYFLIYTACEIKVKLSLCLINKALHYEDVSRSGGIAVLLFLTAALDGGE